MILRDPKSPQPFLDYSRIKLPRDRIKTYTIFEEGFAKFVLYTDIPVGARNADFVRQVDQNYQWLVGDVKFMISQS